MLSCSSVMKSNLGPGVSPKAAKTLFLLCSFQVPRSRCRVFSVQQTSSTPIFLIMLNGPPHCTNVLLLASTGHHLLNVLLLASTGHHLLGSKITRPSLKSSSHSYRRQLLFISLIVIYHGVSVLMPLIMLWVLFCFKSTVILMGRYINPSQKFSGAAVNWDTFKQEAYALYYAVVQFNYYLRDKLFVIETDHRNLVWMESSQVPIVVRREVLLQSFIFEVRHIPGEDNTVVDWLSCMYPPSIDLSSLNSLATTDLPNLLEMFHSVHVYRSLHHGVAKVHSLNQCSKCKRVN